MIELNVRQLIVIAIFASFFMMTTSANSATRVFYDGSEAGNTDLWAQDDYHNKCSSVTTAADGIVGPFAGSRMIRCNSNGTVNYTTPERFESLQVPTFSMTNEVFYRVRFRADTNHDRTSGSAKKILRLFSTGYGSVNDMYSSLRDTTGGLDNEGLFGGVQMTTYWGDAPGDNTANSSSWHTVESYINKATGVVKVWHDDVLVRNQNFGSISGHVGEGGELYITSNFEDNHDAINYSYYDEFEIFTDSSSGTPATGSMSDGTITVSATTYTVTPSAGANGSISPGTVQTVSSGSTTQFTVTPNSGYTASVGGTCGGSLVGTTYTTNPITANCTVSATFASDTTPPVISSPLPSGVQPYGTSSVTLQVTTNEAATCRYNTSNVVYSSMGSTFSSTGGTTHQQPGFSTSNGSSYTRYVRCIDGSGNANTTSAVISFSVSSTSSGPVARAECSNPPSGTVFCADFEEISDAARRAVWDDYDGATDVVFVVDSGPSQVGTNVVASFLAGSSQLYGADLVKVLPLAYDKLYLRYYQYFDPGYSLSWAGHGGGLTAGSRDLIGLSGNRPTGTDYADFTMEYSTAGHLRSYNYYRGMYQDCSNPIGSCHGDSFPCDYDSGASYCTKPHHIKHSSVSWPAFSTGAWRCIEQMVDMGGSLASNLDGTDPNGRYQIWSDGVPLGDYEDLWLRTNTSLKLQNLYMAWRNTSGVSHGSVGQRFDNIVVSTQRVGCGTSTTDTVEPTTSNILPTGTTSSPAALAMTTSENCAAAYSTSRVGHRYKTPFSTTGGTSHSSSVVFANGSYTEHYTCMDAGGNISLPVSASFSVSPIIILMPPTNLRIIN